MSHHNPTAAKLRTLLFHLSDIKRITQPSGCRLEQRRAESHLLIVFTSGAGLVSINDQSFQLSADQCYLLSPGDYIEIIHDYGGGSTIEYYQIAFTVIRTSDAGPGTFTGSILDDRHEITAYPFSRLLRLVEDLHANRQVDCDIKWFHQHMRFQELLGFLIEQNYQSGHALHVTQSVESTVQYMQSNYMENITVKQLAQLANVPYWQYSTVFRELTGKKPLNYLNELRINRSKELLAGSSFQLREIASQVGFADEYYFNRRFRQTTGLTPGQYARIKQSSIRIHDWTGHQVDIPVQPKRIICHGETFGDLIALGVEPIGEVGFLSGDPAYRSRDRKRGGDDKPVNMELTSALNPDLIIFANADEAAYKRIAHIAPTVTFNSFAPLEQRLHTLGELLGRKLEAKRWLDRYNAKATYMWQQLRRSYIVPGETASVFIYEHGRRLFVMGTTGLSSALYHPFGFQPADKIRDILNAGHGFIEIQESALSSYAGDRIFMLVPEHPESRQAMEQMMSSPQWSSLPAVRNGHVYIVQASEWNYADALIREKLLEMLPRLLGKIS
ncbi:HTH-type transcriptional activator Btr [Paenibacillus plantiphilus]|uniref:HTH-type transcriptional activator Btr n=1 Tax=Paenibacillus plantiphilus TaxID=2905650 RepID=A0ABM9CRB6_9BACL|nr:ABC transporter substrate-binding protein [Paenibacillus plantiphilus]CAH1221261.1 HTH-type transcriptional activator Btr [Paenibacillus plantiphilus]